MPELPETVSRKPLLQALRGERLRRPPFWFMRQAGRYLPEYMAVRRSCDGFLDLCFTPEKAAEVTLQPVRRFGMDAAILFSDILVVPHALGQRVAFLEGEGPVLEAVEGIGRLANADSARAVERLASVMETVRRVADALSGETALIGFAGAPWTVATYMVEGGSSKDFGRVKAMSYARPDAFRDLIDLLVETTIAYLDAQIRAGADAVQLFDSWAGALSPAGFADWCVAPTARIVAALKRCHPTTPVIGFPRGVGNGYTAYCAETGVDAVSIDTAVAPGWAAETLQPLCAVQGNLDPALLVVGGRAMLHAADGIVDALGGGPFVFNLGHGITPETPPEHVARLCRHLRDARVP